MVLSTKGTRGLDIFLESIEKYQPIDDDPDRAAFLDTLVPVDKSEEQVLNSMGFEDVGDEDDGKDYKHFYDKKINRGQFGEGLWSNLISFLESKEKEKNK